VFSFFEHNKVLPGILEKPGVEPEAFEFAA